MARRRWDIDERGHGIASGEPLVPDVERLLALLKLPDWVAEEPEAHLLPHLRRACDASQPRLELIDAGVLGGTLVLNLRWSGEGSLLRLRADAFALISSVAESATYLHEWLADQQVVFDVTTGMMPEDTHFHTHGHLLQLRIGGPGVEQIMENRGRAVDSG